MKELRPAILTILLFVVFTGFVFPAVIWVGAQLLFSNQANGSFVHDAKGNIVGSRLIAQGFSLPQYFHPRASAAGSGWDAASSSGTNLGPISKKLIDGIDEDPTTADADESYPGVKDLAQAYRTENGLSPTAKLPADAVTRSGSGLDPEISPQNALLQAARIAKARGMSIEAVQQLVRQNTSIRFLGIFGEPRVNVLEVNLELDSMQ